MTPWARSALVVLALATVALSAQTGDPEAISVFGKPLYPMELTVEQRKPLEANLAEAEAQLTKAPDDEEKIIWLGRRQDLVKPEELLDTRNADDLTIATQGYGVGNWYLVERNRERAREIFEKVVAGRQWAAFWYIAAEVDLKRMREHPTPSR